MWVPSIRSGRRRFGEDRSGVPGVPGAVSSSHGPLGTVSSASANLLVHRQPTVWLGLLPQPCNYH